MHMMENAVPLNSRGDIPYLGFSLLDRVQVLLLVLCKGGVEGMVEGGLSQNLLTFQLVTARHLTSWGSSSTHGEVLNRAPGVCSHAQNTYWIIYFILSRL